LVELKGYRFDHRESLVRLLNNPNVERWLLSVPSPYTYHDADYFISSAICDRDNPDDKRYAIEVGGIHVGGIGLHIKQNYYAEVGYWIGEEYWNRGYATAALKKILSIAFDELHLGRVQAIVFEGNEVSERMLLKCGFEYEGMMKKGRVKNGVPVNCKLYAKVI
jgi:RimJ/RimL family protein N-acetyltransferase